MAALAVTVLLYGSLYARETTLSYSIGYNLYGAERALEGQVPYRDFQMLYPPGTVYVNAAIFEALGISLRAALLGVLVFKVMTILMLCVCGLELMPGRWAFCAAICSLPWLRPNGPFKAVPMHYGAFFLAAAMFFLLRHNRSRGRANLFVAGAALGFLALFKHNIAAYALIGSMAFIFIGGGLRRESFWQAAALLIGMLIPILAAAAYMSAEGALVPMVRALALGPGEFLADRLAAMPSPIYPLAFWSLAIAAARWYERAKALCLALALCLAALLFVVGRNVTDPIIFYAPAAVIIIAIWAHVARREIEPTDRRALVVTAAFAWSAFMESFPRFAQEQSIAAMPFVVLLSFHLARASAALVGWPAAKRLLALLPAALLLLGLKTFLGIYFAGGFKLKSDVRLDAGRARGVYFPREVAAEITEVVAYIQERVPPGGYFFAHSRAGSSYLFLSGRRSPSRAQFWGGVGVSEEERAATLRALEERGVRLVLTSEQDLASEKYEPMRAYLSSNFRPSRRIGSVLVLER